MRRSQSHRLHQVGALAKLIVLSAHSFAWLLWLSSAAAGTHQTISGPSSSGGDALISANWLAASTMHSRHSSATSHALAPACPASEHRSVGTPLTLTCGAPTSPVQLRLTPSAHWPGVDASSCRCLTVSLSPSESTQKAPLAAASPAAVQCSAGIPTMRNCVR